MAHRSYGCTRSFGCSTYSCDGYSSLEEAKMNVYSRAFKNGDWSPPKLREKWWQFWRPTSHTELEAHFAGLDRAQEGE